MVADDRLTRSLVKVGYAVERGGFVLSLEIGLHHGDGGLCMWFGRKVVSSEGAAD